LFVKLACLCLTVGLTTAVDFDFAPSLESVLGNPGRQEQHAASKRLTSVWLGFAGAALFASAGAMVGGLVSARLPVAIACGLAILGRLTCLGMEQGIRQHVLRENWLLSVAFLWAGSVFAGYVALLEPLRRLARESGIRPPLLDGCVLAAAAVGATAWVRGMLQEAFSPATTSFRLGALCFLAMCLLLIVRVRRPSDGEEANGDKSQSALASAWQTVMHRDVLWPWLGLWFLAAFLGLSVRLAAASGAPLEWMFANGSWLYGLAVGALWVGLLGHPFRMLGWTPYAWLALVIVVWASPNYMATSMATGSEVSWANLLSFCFVGMIGSALLGRLQIVLPERMRGLLLGMCVAGGVLLAHGSSAVCGWGCWPAGLADSRVPSAVRLGDAHRDRAANAERLIDEPAAPLTARGRMPPLFFCLAGTAFSLWAFPRATLELTAALPAMLLYRIRAVGPGLREFPWRGPVVVIANHAAWFDPLWLGKVVPRRLTPMMTSKFYDLPVLRWLMPKLGVIRVVEGLTYRHEAPELKEAVDRLTRGECVLIFPEGYLRRTEEQVLRRFGQGVWRILHEQPGMPVVPCWIEGGWGSYLSFKDGPPGKGKPFDWWLPITIVVGKPEVLTPEMLADHRATRAYLERQVLALRQTLPGKEPIADSWQKGETEEPHEAHGDAP